MKFIKQHGLTIYAVIATIALIVVAWVYSYGSPTELVKGIITNVVYGLIIFLLVKFIPNPREKKIIDFLEKFDKSQAFSYIHRIQSSRDTFVSKFPFLTKLWDSFISDRIDEIESGSNGEIIFSSETQRDLFIDKLFNHLDAIPDIRLIQSMTWDGDGYFTDYWRSIGNTSGKFKNSFEMRNDIAQNKNIIVERLFVFKRDNIDSEKKILFNRLYDQNKRTLNTHMKWIYEEDLKPLHLQSYGMERSSFLLVIDSNKNTRVVTQNFQLQTLELNKQSYAKFINENNIKLEPSTIFTSIYSYANDSKIR